MNQNNVETTLEKQIMQVIDSFEADEKLLKEKKKEAIAHIIQYNIKSGLLKNELS